MLAVGGFDKLPARLAVKTGTAHESANSANTVLAVTGRQFSLNTRRTITAFVLIVDVFNQQFEVSIFRFSC